MRTEQTVVTQLEQEPADLRLRVAMAMVMEWRRGTGYRGRRDISDAGYVHWDRVGDLETFDCWEHTVYDTTREHSDDLPRYDTEMGAFLEGPGNYASAMGGRLQLEVVPGFENAGEPYRARYDDLEWGEMHANAATACGFALLRYAKWDKVLELMKG